MTDLITSCLLLQKLRYCDRAPDKQPSELRPHLNQSHKCKTAEKGKKFAVDDFSVKEYKYKELAIMLSSNNLFIARGTVKSENDCEGITNRLGMWGVGVKL